MNLHYLELVSFLDAATSNPRSFVTGQLHPFKSMASGVELDALLKTWQHDRMVETTLRVCLLAMAKLCKKLFADYLPTGKFGNPSHSASETVKNMPKHDNFSETICGVLDQLLRAKPNVSTLAATACIMFRHNKTLVCLKNKNQSSQAELIQSSVRRVKAVRRTLKARSQAVEMAHRVRAQERIARAEQHEQRKVRQKEAYTADNTVWAVAEWRGSWPAPN